MILRGANIGESFVNLKKLSSYNWTDDADTKKLIVKLENLYLQINNNAQNQIINQMQIDQDGQVIIEKNAINHRCSNSLETLKSIACYGILASEWFGILESEREGCFCTFVSRMKGTNYPYHGSLAEDDKSRLNIGKDIILFFDDKKPVMQYLIHLDYFEFMYHQKTNKDYKNLYTKDELDILEDLIEPFSKSGNDMRKSYDFKTNYWSAIPGGIPSFLINGICIKNNSYTEEELNEINLLFPNATIFNSSKKSN